MDPTALSIIIIVYVFFIIWIFNRSASSTYNSSTTKSDGYFEKYTTNIVQHASERAITKTEIENKNALIKTLENTIADKDKIIADKEKLIELLDKSKNVENEVVKKRSGK